MVQKRLSEVIKYIGMEERKGKMRVQLLTVQYSIVRTPTTVFESPFTQQVKSQL